MKETEFSMLLWVLLEVYWIRWAMELPSKAIMHESVFCLQRQKMLQIGEFCRAERMDFNLTAKRDSVHMSR